MAYRRRYKKRTYRRRYGRRRALKSKYRRGYKLSGNNKTYYYTRYIAGNALGAIVLGNATDSLSAFNFSLNDVVNYTEFTALYDMYKINAVKLTFLPQMTENISLSSLNNPYANVRFYSAIDRNDGTSPTTVDQLREYKTCKFTPILKPHKRYIYKPKILDTNGFSISPWMTTTSPSANYYGLKVGIEAMLSTNITSMSYTIEAKYYLAFKNVK